MTRARVVVGTRGSALARWQAAHVVEILRRAYPSLAVEESIIVTTGDRTTSGPVWQAGGKGVWVKEIEAALLEGTIDLAVHSLKDVPVELAAGLELAAIPARADPRDALVSRGGAVLDALPAGARVGTSSLRRVCQIKAARPDITCEVLRGNLDSRLRKVHDGGLDAAVLACAGLDRLGLGHHIAERLPPHRVLPAIGQGALAIETRLDDVRDLCRVLADPTAEATVAAERALLRGLGAGCRTPVAGTACIEGDRLDLRGLVGRPDGSEILREHRCGPVQSAADLGAAVAEALLARGARRILADLG